MANPEVTVYVDGSCRGQGLETARSGWAFVIEGDIEQKHFGKVPGEKHDSNRAEAYALLEAMKWMVQYPHVAVNFRSDSSLLLGGIRSKKGRSLNADIWSELGPLLEENRHRIRTVKWIPREENLADGLAKQAAIAFVLLDDNGVNMEFDMDTIRLG